MATTAVIIKQENESKIQQMIDDAQGRATARVIDINDILNATVKIEAVLNVPKKYLEGIVYSVDMNAQDFPHAYKYVPESTHFTLTYKNGTWRVSDIIRAQCRTYGHAFVCENMSAETEQAIIRSKKVF
jgi:hypothetical protein